MSKNTNAKKLKKAIKEYQDEARKNIVEYINAIPDMETKMAHIGGIIAKTQTEEILDQDTDGIIVARLRRETATSVLYCLIHGHSL